LGQEKGVRVRIRVEVKAEAETGDVLFLTQNSQFKNRNPKPKDPLGGI
jgi:hypothetical protein